MITLQDSLMGIWWSVARDLDVLDVYFTGWFFLSSCIRAGQPLNTYLGSWIGSLSDDLAFVITATALL